MTDLLDVLAQSAPVGLAVVDEELRFVHVNPALAALNGLPVEAHLGRPVADVLPEFAPELVGRCRAVLSTGEAVHEREISGAAVTHGGEPRHALASWFPLRTNGRISHVGIVVHDITRRRRQDERQALLLDVGEVLDSALGVDERLDRLARLLVPRLADFCKIELLEAAGGRRPVAIAHEDPEREAVMRQLRASMVLPREEPVGMAATLATGKARLTRDIAGAAAADSAREQGGDDAAALMDAVGPRSQVVVPLQARGRVLGALSLTMAESGRRYGPQDLALARDLGLRAGLAVDNARLYEEARELAEAERRRGAQLDALASASLAIHRTRVLEERVQRIADHARELTGARRATVRMAGVEAVSLWHDEGEAPGQRLHAALLGRDGEPFGEIEVAGRREGRFTPADQLVLDDLARHSALAVENARLEERERLIARTLQDGLLPASLPTVPGLQVAARYLPGGEGIVVGGDFYDLFAVDGEWAFVVGDVVGKGAGAAVLTAMVRYTIRAEALHERSPGRVLGLVNAAMLRQHDDGRFCTAVHGRVRPGAPGTGAELALAAGGHPAPLLLRASGDVAPVRAAGRLLGITPDVDHRDAAVRLEPGDALVCFTDGVTEARGPGGQFGDERLAALLAGARGASADALAGRVADTVLAHQGGAAQDDVAVLVLRAAPSPGSSSRACSTSA